MVFNYHSAEHSVNTHRLEVCTGRNFTARPDKISARPVFPFTLLARPVKERARPGPVATTH